MQFIFHRARSVTATQKSVKKKNADRQIFQFWSWLDRKHDQTKKISAQFDLKKKNR